MTFAFVHRTHFEALGEFFPHSFPNWWSDFWITLIYGRHSTHWTKEVHVRNTEVAGRRYPAFWASDGLLKEEVAKARAKLIAFCGCAREGGEPRLHGCQLGAHTG